MGSNPERRLVIAPRDERTPGHLEWAAQRAAARFRVNPDTARCQSALVAFDMSRSNRDSSSGTGACVLSIEQLEVGLRVMAQDDFESNAFWDENVEAFRRTVLMAIRDTSDALLSPTITLRWRVELESQLEALIQYIELADRYIAHRLLSEGSGPASLLKHAKIH